MSRNTPCCISALDCKYLHDHWVRTDGRFSLILYFYFILMLLRWFGVRCLVFAFVTVFSSFDSLASRSPPRLFRCRHPLFCRLRFYLFFILRFCFFSVSVSVSSCARCLFFTVSLALTHFISLSLFLYSEIYYFDSYNEFLPYIVDRRV